VAASIAITDGCRWNGLTMPSPIRAVVVWWAIVEATVKMPR
jgi:hypothetical protein